MYLLFVHFDNDSFEVLQNFQSFDKNNQTQNEQMIHLISLDNVQKYKQVELNCNLSVFGSQTNELIIEEIYYYYRLIRYNTRKTLLNLITLL